MLLLSWPSLRLILSPSPVSFQLRVPSRVDPSCLAVYFRHCPKRSPSGLLSELSQSFLSAWMLVSRHFEFYKFLIFNIQSVASQHYFVLSLAVCQWHARFARNSLTMSLLRFAYLFFVPSKMVLF